MATQSSADQLVGILRDTVVALVRRDGPDLSARQLGVFLTCYLQEGAHTVRGLAAELNVSKPAITRALDRLGELDLARRKVLRSSATCARSCPKLTPQPARTAPRRPSRRPARPCTANQSSSPSPLAGEGLGEGRQRSVQQSSSLTRRALSSLWISYIDIADPAADPFHAKGSLHRG
jgi:hypothetical protein